MRKSKGKYVALFEVEFLPEMLCGTQILREEYGNSWFNCVKYLYQEEGLGIFMDELKLVDVYEKA